jgi:XTP/dITP diphosphohydrolase
VKIILSTKNEGKIREIKNIFNIPGIELLTYRDFEDWPSISEDGKSFEENAIKKAQVVKEKFNLPAIADDSGLEIDYLKGKPGVLSSRYSGGGDEENIRKVLRELEGVPLEERKARFRCVAVFFSVEDVILTAEGVCEGHIAFSPRGEKGFGYDPIFIPLGYDKTMAELSLSEKNKISHRGKAFRRLKEKVLDYLT